MYTSKEKLSFNRGRRLGFHQGIHYAGKSVGYKDARTFNQNHIIKILKELKVNQSTLANTLLKSVNYYNNPNETNRDDLVSTVFSIIWNTIKDLPDMRDRDNYPNNTELYTPQQMLIIWGEIPNTVWSNDNRWIKPAFFIRMGWELPYTFPTKNPNNSDASEYIQRTLRGDLPSSAYDMGLEFIEDIVYTGEPDIEAEAVEQAEEEMRRIQDVGGFRY